jgi:hypothetical protein
MKRMAVGAAMVFIMAVAIGSAQAKCKSVSDSRKALKPLKTKDLFFMLS